MSAAKSSLPDYIHHSGPSLTSQDNLHIFFIPGNPGLISYYTTFLSSLHRLLNTSLSLHHHPLNGAAVYGRSLRGFEAAKPFRLELCRVTNDPGDPRRDPWHNNRSPDNGVARTPLDLRGQIGHVEKVLRTYMTSFVRPEDAKGRPKVVLVGHSVGAYILMSIVDRHRARYERFGKEGGEESLFDIVGGICLFPTVADIAASPAGRRVGWVVRVMWPPVVVAGMVQVFLWAILTMLGKAWLEKLVGWVTGFPREGAETTAEFLRSWGGVRESLYLAHDEMISITADRWGSHVWGSATDESTKSPNSLPPTKLFFYFAESDHWVANRTRDDLMAARGFKKDGDAWKPKMEVDKTGIPHGFCIRHSESVALKCRNYIEQIAEVAWVNSVKDK